MTVLSADVGVRWPAGEATALFLTVSFHPFGGYLAGKIDPTMRSCEASACFF